MNCPRCRSEILMEIVRDGVRVDRCSSCQGLWFDRGEIDLLLTRFEGSRRLRDDDDDDDDRWEDDRGGPRGGSARDAHPPRKRRWFESFTEIFD